MKKLLTLLLLTATTSALPAEPPAPVVLKGHTQAVTVVAWAADSKTIATASDDRSIKFWNATTGRETATHAKMAVEGYGGPVVAFTADLKTAAINYWGEITIRTLADGKIRTKIDPILDRGTPSTFRPDVYALAFSPDGKRLATAGSLSGPGIPGGVIIIWDVETGKVLHQTAKLATAPGAVTWSPDGKFVAAGTNGVGGELPEPGEVWVWEAANGKVVKSFKVKPKVEYGEWASAGDVVFSPDGMHVAAPVTAGSRSAPAGLLLEDTGASVRVWDLATNKDTQPVKGLKASLTRIVFSPDGKQLATAGRDKMVRVWAVATGKELATQTCPDQVTAIAFSPDGKFLAAGATNGVIHIWPAPEMR